eukprot:m.920034 g.920034  ORF g.920034 m.920034 type:complete len:149 (+) comp60835_c0_seq1:14-460(+)
MFPNATPPREAVEKACYAVIDNNETALWDLVIKYGLEILTIQTNVAYEGATALHLMCADNCSTLLEEFMRERVNFNVVDGHGDTPLKLAAYCGSTECARVLCAFGAGEKDGLAALQFAHLRGHNEIVAIVSERLQRLHAQQNIKPGCH